MKAHVGDRIIVASPTTGGVVRDGEIVEVRGADGAPPYVVRWAGSTNTGLYFPGSDARVSGTQGPEAEEPTEMPHVRTWRVDIDLFETGDDTAAHAVLVAEAPRHLDARGEAHRRKAEAPVPEIGDEVAVARALRRLSDRLLEAASADLSAIEGHHVSVTQ